MNHLRSTFQMVRHSAALAVASALALIALAAPVQAKPVSYIFSGTTGSGTVLDFGGGPVAAAGIAFTVFGRTVNDIDLTAPGDSFGLFAATSTYNFGSFGSFTTNAGGDRYFQNCFSPTAISCVGLYDPFLAAGFLVGFTPISTNPDFGLAIGTPAGAYFAGSSGRYQVNAAGQQIFLNVGSITGLFIGTVPEPGTLSLTGLLLGGLAWNRRRRSSGAGSGATAAAMKGSLPSC